MLGEQLKLLRATHKLSQAQLGKMLNVSQQAVAKWEINASTPDLPTLTKLTEIFGLSSIEDLLNSKISIPNDFPSRLKNLRLSNALTQTQLAEIINVSSLTIGTWEKGESMPDLVNVLKIANYYKISVDYLIGRTNIPNTRSILSRSEKELLKNYRRLDIEDQAEIRVEIKHMLRSNKYKALPEKATKESDDDIVGRAALAAYEGDTTAPSSYTRKQAQEIYEAQKAFSFDDDDDWL